VSYIQAPMNEITPKKENHWIRGLDSVRFFLALLVFLSHLANPYHDLLAGSPHLVVRAIGMASSLLFNGVGAVIAFFIISGFVIHYPYRHKVPDTLPFLVRRWLRIGLPLLVISLIASGFHIFSEIPIWSLYCELIYYTLYPLLIRIKISWMTKFAITFVIALVLIAILVPNDWSSLLHQKDMHYDGAYWQLGPGLTWIIGLPCWLLGVILADRLETYRRKITGLNIYAFRFGVLGVSILLNLIKFHYFVSFILTMNLFSILLFFWLKNEILYYRNRQPVRLFERCGEFSYSLYLCHNVIVFLLAPILPVNGYTWFPIVIITIFFSYLFYLAAERPSHLLSRQLASWVARKPLTFNKGA